MLTSALSGSREPRVVQVVVLEVRHGFVHVGHLVLHLLGHLLLLALAGLGLGAERDRLGEVAVSSTAMVPPRMSGRSRWSMSIGWSIIMRNFSGSLMRPWMTWTKPASSDPPSSISCTSSQSWNVTAPLKYRSVSPHQAPCSGPVAVAHRRLLRVEAHDADELVVVGQAVRASEEAHRARLELLTPQVHATVQLVARRCTGPESPE